jgi:hypothetical protein
MTKYITEGHTVDDIRVKIEKMTDSDKQTALGLLAKLGIDLSEPKTELTGTGVSAFILQGKMYEADSHKDVYVQLNWLLMRKYPDKKDLVFTVQGRKKKYVSKKVSDFKNIYEQIPGTNVYLDTNENATQLNRRCQRLLQAFGIDPTMFMIIPN